MGAERKVLVTGATGFLGSHLARRLVDRGDQVRVLVRPTSDLGRLAGLSLDHAQGDVTDMESVTRAVEGVDVVYHTAALVEMNAPPDRMRAVNVEGTRNVLGAAADAGALAIYVSSLAALGPTGTDPVDESWWNPTEPVVAYEQTKREAHLVARQFATDGAHVRIGIPGGIYGYGDTSSMAKLIEIFSKYPTPIGYLPDLVQSLVNVDDCADGLMLIADAGADGEEYVLCGDPPVTFREWFECIAAGAGRRPPFVYIPTSLVRWSERPAAAVTRLLGRDPRSLTETMALATRSQSFSCAKACRELGWKPRDLHTGMAEMARAIRRGTPGVLTS